MTRQIDIKALISHIVKGDGAEKCRICMGDTIEGQVHLGDTVLMDGDRHVTLSELLQTITGVQVLLDKCLPSTICATCSESALLAARFQYLCQKSRDEWNNAVYLVEIVPRKVEDWHQSLFIIKNDMKFELINDLKQCINPSSALIRLNKRLKASDEQQKRMKFRNTRKEYFCPDCGKKFDSALQVHIHFRDRQDERRACYVCGAIMTRDELIKHLAVEHNEWPIQCQKCSYIFRDRINYEKHLIDVHSSGPGFVHCRDCGHTFASKIAIAPHTKIHLDHTCSNCNTKLYNYKCYKHHWEQYINFKRHTTYNPEKKVYKRELGLKEFKRNKFGMFTCDYCNKSFRGKANIHMHITKAHMKSEKCACSFCGLVIDGDKLGKHIRSHIIVRTFNCEHCGAVMKSRIGYKQHIRLHTGEKPFECKLCGERFNAASRLSNHKRRRHKTLTENRVHKCKHCPASYVDARKLSIHLINKHGDGPELLYPCLKCGKSFAKTTGLDSHDRLVHQKEIFFPKQHKTVKLQSTD